MNVIFSRLFTMFFSEYFLNTYALLIFVCSLVWYYYSTYTFDHWKKQKIPFRRPLSVFGNTARYIFLRLSFHEFVDEMYTHFKDDALCGFFQMTEPALLIRDPDIARDILVRDFSKFQDHGFQFWFAHKELNPLSVHLFMMEGNRWREIRKKLNPAFTSSKLRLMEDQIMVCLSKLNLLIDENMPHGDTDQNLKVLYDKLTLDVIGSCAFGIDCNSAKNDEFRIMGAKALNLSFTEILATFLDKKYRLLFKLTDFPKKVTDFFKPVILNMLLQRRKDSVKRNDLFQILMDLQNSHVDPKYAVAEQPGSVSQNEQFDEIDIVGNSFAFFLAGYETSSSAISYCLYELALNLSVQNKLRAEVEDVYEKNNKKLTVNILHDLKYLDAVISETLRKYPSVPVLNRICTQDYQFRNSDIRIKKGASVMIPVWSIQHDAKYFPNPEQFDPARFYGTNKNNIHMETYLPFGDGPRGCIGMTFAKMEIKLTIADAVLKYQFEPCSKTETPITYKGHCFIMTAKNGIWVTIKKRQTAITS